MAQRIGAHTVRLERPPAVAAHAGLAGKKEREGPLGACFDKTFDDTRFGKKTWEQAEQTLLRRALELAKQKLPPGTPPPEIIFAGDLENQCTASSFAFAQSGMPFCGLYGACSTMALTLALAALAVEAGACRTAASSGRRWANHGRCLSSCRMTASAMSLSTSSRPCRNRLV